MNNHILVPIDLAHPASFDLIFPAIAAIASSRAATLHLLSVVPDELAIWPYVPRNFIEDARKQAAEQLEEIAHIDMPEDIEWHSEALVGRIAPTIVRRAVDHGVGLIVIASHDPRATDILLGGVADRVLRRAPCSVLVLRASGDWQWSG